VENQNNFGLLSNISSTLYHPTENLTLDEVIVKFKGRMVFQQQIPKQQKQFGIKLYRLFDGNGYTYDMAVYFRRTTFECCFEYYTYPWKSSAANKEGGRCWTHIVHG
jgi:hypothetical protein